MSSNNPFPVIDVRAEDSIGDEVLGTKNKFWMEIAGERWLFKEGRPNTGEDWSEKLAAEIAKVLDIPAAVVELADCQGKRGTVSLSFIDRESGEDLVHGNEILAGQVLGYDPGKRFGQSDHTVENIQRAVTKLFPEPKDSEFILTQLASYMVLDGLIGNVDRHHENWGLVLYPVSKEGRTTYLVRMAPTFDHASCLGRELLDRKITQILNGPHGIANYINKGRGAVYLSSNDKRGANPLRLVEYGNRHLPDYFKQSIDLVKSCDLNMLLDLVDRIPDDRISHNAIQFVKLFLTHSYQRICNLST